MDDHTDNHDLIHQYVRESLIEAVEINIDANGFCMTCTVVALVEQLLARLLVTSAKQAMKNIDAGQDREESVMQNAEIIKEIMSNAFREADALAAEMQATPVPRSLH